MPFIKGHKQFNTGRTWLKKGHRLNKGKKLTEAHKKKLSESHKGQKPWNTGKKGIRLNPDTEFKKGSIPWNKGISNTWYNPKGLEKGRGFFKGKHNPAISKENHWNWQGGITPKNLAIRMTLEYKQWRKAVFERDDYTCQLCGKRGRGELHVDHIKSFSKHPELRFSLDNGRTLCIDCHKTTENYGQKAKN